MTGTASRVGIPLALGGHTFISQLGNDPPATAHEQQTIVESCLDRGITWFDTTYQPERVALGNVLQALGRREEATILAWNFFTDFKPGDPVGGSEYYHPGHIHLILEQLRTSYVDYLIVHALDDPEANRRQEDLAVEWQKEGYVRALGLWNPDPATAESYRSKNPYQCVIRPLNITTGDVAPSLAIDKALGWQTLVTSPFVRGWELDRMVLQASSCGYGEAETLRPLLADLMLRFALFQPHVDRVIIAMRKTEWIARNIESVRRGPLNSKEMVWLRRLRCTD